MKTDVAFVSNRSDIESKTLGCQEGENNVLYQAVQPFGLSSVDKHVTPDRNVTPTFKSIWKPPAYFPLFL